MRYLFYISLIILILSGCEKDRMENYRSDFSDDFTFQTIIRDEGGVIDTIDFTGTIEPVYSNLKNIIYIHFVPDFMIDPLLKENGQLASNAWWSSQRVPISIAGSFHNNNQDIVFSYLIGTDQNYILYQVSGHRIN
jgi:hypothetical protein